MVNTAIDFYRAPAGIMPATPAEPRANSAAATDRIDLRRLLAMFRRRIGVFLGVLLGVLAIGMVITALQPRTYQARAEVTLNSKLQPVAPTSTNDRADQPAIPSESFVDTQVSVITSETNTAAVADALGLARDPRFAPEAGNAAGKAGTAQQSSREAAIRYLSKNVTAQRIGTTYGIAITFDSRDPQEAARIANAFAEQYTLGALENKRSGARETTSVIANRLEQLRQQALADSAAVQRYRIAHNLLSTTQGTLTEQEISSYNQEVTAARAQASEDAARLEAAQRQLQAGGSGGVGEASLSPVIGQMRAQQAGLAGEFAALSSRYGPQHPDVLRARAQLEAVNRQIAAETQRVLASLEAKARVSQQRLSSLAGSLNASRGMLEQNNAAMVGLNDLEKRAETSNALYESYLNRYKELTAREGTEQADADMLHRADVPRNPSSPHVLINAVLALALGTGLGIATAFLTEMTFTGLTTGEDIEERLGVRYLCAIPTLQSVAKRGERVPASALLEDPRSVFAESFRSLRASIAMNTTEARIIAITSALPEEGKTTTSICLARSMAAAGDRILLIDGDLRRQGVSRFLRGGEGRPGLMEVLHGTASLDDAMVIDPATGLSILPLSAENTDRSELMTGEEMDRLLATARERFDAVIIDTAPVLPIADARLLLGKADASVFVVRWRKTPEQALRAALRLLPIDRVQLAGVAMTRVDMRKQPRFDYGETAFYRSYESYYA
ncbi:MULTISPECIES: GumC family protein [unclassified Novosphingobium]|uniref:GumC family protein n=1 Tax=Novosphingobium TaxID=165696 RepID=UPI00146D3A14|nr:MULTISPECIES: polysaccharide biosynthesis tyrosine autokinase [unclassified Novosphingobium]NMN06388.1 capsular exopolysaccharide synthesis family protein [Novosphingobium sp. SG919]NMN88686.1 capsular exopolysaccharide synthesis family protein [Novosphingobium sp. SG916]